MAERIRYRVAATMIVVRVPGAQGGEVYLNRGALLPLTVEADEIKRLVALGVVAKVEAKAEAAEPAKAEAK